MSSGRSASSDASGSEDDEAKEVSAAATPLGLMTSNSVVVAFPFFLGSSRIAPLIGSGAGLGGTYYVKNAYNQLLS